MSIVHKGLNRSDVYLTDYNSRRKWEVTGSNLAELGVRTMIALSSSRPYLPVDEDVKPFIPYTGTVGITSSYVSGSYNQKLLYGSIYERYYEGSLEDGTFSGSRDWSLPSSLTLTGSRVVPKDNFKGTTDPTLPEHQQNKANTGFVIISLPKDIIGVGISEGSFKLDPDEDVFSYVEEEYMENESGSICDEGYPIGTYTRPSDHWVDPYFEDLRTQMITDFEGLLIGNGFAGVWHQPEEYRYPTPIHRVNVPVGDIIYAQGQVILTNSFIRYLLENWDFNKISWESNKPIFTKHVTCKVRDIDFNRTFNRTASEKLQNTPGFTPYVTAVGLYNSEGELLAVAKLSKPIKKALDTEMTFDIQIDLG